MRFYGFKVEEVVNDQFPTLDMSIDPKLSWALRNMHFFPVEINSASHQSILRVPGIGVGSAKKIVAARRYGKLNWQQLKNIGVAVNKARFFIICDRTDLGGLNLKPGLIRNQLLALSQSKFKSGFSPQLTLF